MSHVPYIIFIVAAFTGVVMWATHGVVYGFSPNPTSPVGDLEALAEKELPTVSKLTEVLHLIPTISEAVQTVEAVSKTALDKTMTGAQKLAAAMQIVEASLAASTDATAQAIGAKFSEYAPTIQGVVAALVTIYNLVGVFIKVPH